MIGLAVFFVCWGIVIVAGVTFSALLIRGGRFSDDER